MAYRIGRTPFGLKADVAYSSSDLTTEFLDNFSGLDDGNAAAPAS